MQDRNYFSRIMNNINRAYYFKEQELSDSVDWHYADFYSKKTDIKQFRKIWKKFCANYFKRTEIKMFGLIEHQRKQGDDFGHLHIHAVIISDAPIPKHGRLLERIRFEWKRAGGTTANIILPNQNDPFEKFRYLLKGGYGERLPPSKRTKPSDKHINHHLYLNLDPLPWSGISMPSNHIHHSKHKQLVREYFSKEKKTFPTSIRPII